jgi:two-component system, response regulator FlrC
MSEQSLLTCSPIFSGSTRQPGPIVAEAVSHLLGCPLHEVERALILATLDHCDGNRTRAAKQLGISVRTLRNRITECLLEGIEVRGPGGTFKITASEEMLT